MNTFAPAKSSRVSCIRPSWSCHSPSSSPCRSVWYHLVFSCHLSHNPSLHMKIVVAAAAQQPSAPWLLLTFGQQETEFSIRYFNRLLRQNLQILESHSSLSSAVNNPDITIGLFCDNPDEEPAQESWACLPSVTIIYTYKQNTQT